jgi:uncharacterized membrane protein
MITKKEICYLNNNYIYYANDNKKNKLDIILSPYFYWYFKQKLPVSNKKRAKSIAREFFANRLENKEYEYIINPLKEKNTFEVFAVDMSRVYEVLKGKNIDKSMISSISFASYELVDTQIECDDTHLIVKDGEAFEISKSQNIIADAKPIKEAIKSIDKLNFKHQISKGGALENVVDFVDNNYIHLIFISIFVSISFGINIYLKYNEQKLYESKQATQMEKQKYADHAIQLEYVKKNYEKIDKDAKMFRKKFASILSLNSSASVYMTKIFYEDKIFDIDVQAPAKPQADAFVAPLKANFISANQNKFSYEIK